MLQQFFRFDVPVTDLVSRTESSEAPESGQTDLTRAQTNWVQFAHTETPVIEVMNALALPSALSHHLSSDPSDSYRGRQHRTLRTRHLQVSRSGRSARPARVRTTGLPAQHAGSDSGARQESDFSRGAGATAIVDEGARGFRVFAAPVLSVQYLPLTLGVVACARIVRGRRLQHGGQRRDGGRTVPEYVLRASRVLLQNSVTLWDCRARNNVEPIHCR